MINNIKLKKDAFTLVEFLLYITLFFIFFLSLFSILHIVYNNQAKNNIRLEVEQQGLFISQIISQEIRNAVTIISPVNQGNSLSLETYDNSRSPVNISLVDDQILYQEGANQVLNLSSPRVEVLNLNFTNNTINNVSSIHFSFTLKYQDFSKEFFGLTNLNLINL